MVQYSTVQRVDFYFTMGTKCAKGQKIKRSKCHRGSLRVRSSQEHISSELVSWRRSILFYDEVTKTLKSIKGPGVWYTPLLWQKWIKLLLSGPLTYFTISVDNILVLTTLITLIMVHITSMFISPHVSLVKLNIYARLICRNISESFLNVLRISYWWDIRAIYISRC